MNGEKKNNLDALIKSSYDYQIICHWLVEKHPL